MSDNQCADCKAYREEIAHTARVIEAQTLDVKALGKGRRDILERWVDRLRRIAVGQQVEPLRKYGRFTQVEILERANYGVDA